MDLRGFATRLQRVLATYFYQQRQKIGKNAAASFCFLMALLLRGHNASRSTLKGIGPKFEKTLSRISDYTLGHILCP